MDKNSILKYLSYATIAIAVIVLSYKLLSEPNKAEAMAQASRPLMFLMIGFILFFVISCREKKNKGKYVTALILSIVLLLTSSIILLSLFLKMRNDLVAKAIADNSDSIIIKIQQIPEIVSLVTAAIFIILIYALCIMEFSAFKNKRKIQRIAGIIIVIISLVALAGYAINNELMYYTIEGFTKGMSLDSALLSLIMGSATFLIGRE